MSDVPEFVPPPPPTGRGDQPPPRPYGTHGTDGGASPSCAEVEDAEAAYVWGALEADQRARIDAHRRECPACERRLAAAERVVAALDQAHPRLAPPPALRTRLLAAIANLPASAEPSAAPPPPRAATPASSPPAGVPSASNGPSPSSGLPLASGALSPSGAPSPLGEPPPSGEPPSTGEPSASDRLRPGVPSVTRGASVHAARGRAAPASRRPAWRAGPFFAGVGTGVLGSLAVAALITLLVVRPDALGLLGGGQAQFGPGPSDQAPQPPAISLPGPLPGSAGRLVELRASSGAGRGLLAYDPQTRRGVLLLEDLPGSAAGSDYTVWLVQAAQRVQLGSLTPDAHGSATFALPDPLPLDRPERIEVVHSQPSPGSAPVVLAASL